MLELFFLYLDNVFAFQIMGNNIFCAFQQTPHIWHQLALFFRDELLSWSWRRPLGVPSPQVATGGINPMDFEQKVTTNVDNVIGRIKGIAPQYFSEEVLHLCLSNILLFYFIF